jgi:hypothetical protein
LQGRSRELDDAVESHRTFNTETVAATTAAFDRVCQSVSQRNDNGEQAPAQMILPHVDLGERDTERLADAALREWTAAVAAG